MAERSVTTLGDIEFRTVRRDDPNEYRAYARIYWDIQVGMDPYFTRRTDEFVDNWVEAARARETDRNSYAGIALHDGQIVGIYVVRAHDSYGLLGAHVAGLWVRDDYRRMGLTLRLREGAEDWARSIGADFMEANVHVDNERMLELSEKAGYRRFRVVIRKDLR